MIFGNTKTLRSKAVEDARSRVGIAKLEVIHAIYDLEVKMVEVKREEEILKLYEKVDKKDEIENE